MFNQFAFTILERLCGQKLAVMLHALSGTTERTWRNRFKRGWEPTEDERKHFQDRTTAALIERMASVGEWPPDEARKILAERPSAIAGAGLPTADLIYQFSPRYGEYCREAISLAIHFDRDCEALEEAVRLGSVENVRKIFSAMLIWLRTYCPEDTDVEDAQVLQRKLENSPDIEALLIAAKPLVEAQLLHVLSCWDIEFCAGYFDGTMEAYPLFELVMPRLATDIENEPETGRFLRDGRPPRKKLYETATARLFDFLAVLVAWRRYRRLPRSLPRVKDFAAWSCQDESRVVSWRDETTRFTARQLEHLWTQAFVPDGQGIYPAIPSPMFVCAHLWSPLLVRDGRRITHHIDCTQSYRLWWERNLERLVAKGMQFGKQTWPDYLTTGRPGGGSFASVLSAQSAGRSSHPRDCQ